MECLIGIKGKDFVVLAADTTAGRSIVVYKKDQDKMYELSKRLLMAVVGDGGDTVQFAEYIAKNIQLYRMRNGYDLSVSGAANFTRRNLADSIRSSKPYNVNLLIGGYDEKDGPGLYYMDYLGSKAEVPYTAHGYGSYFVLGLLDRYYTPDLTKERAVELLQMCANEIKTRFLIDLDRFKVKIVDSEGVHPVKDVQAKRLLDINDTVAGSGQDSSMQQ